MSGSLSAILAIVIPGALSLVVAFLLLRRGRPWLGAIAGTGVIVAAQVMMQVRLYLDIQACIERACRFMENQAACDAASFGCSEWTGLASLAFLIAGVLDLVLLVVAYAIARIAARRQARTRSTP
jgi:hypothetical protein